MMRMFHPARLMGLLALAADGLRTKLDPFGQFLPPTGLCSAPPLELPPYDLTPLAPVLALPLHLPRRGTRAHLRGARKDFERELAAEGYGNRAARRQAARQLRFEAA